MRLVSALFVLLVALSACGSSGPRTVASVKGQDITTADIQQYERYALRFYAWVRADGAVGSEPACNPDATSGPCLALRRQVLARLIQERLILAYAQSHRIGLSPADDKLVQARTDAYTSGKGSSLHRLGITPAFLRGVVQRQILIAKVESKVTARQLASTAPDFYVKRYQVPTTGGRSSAEKAAATLATAGRPVPPGTRVDTLWLHPSDLNTSARALLQTAEPGQFTGPFPGGHGYLVYRVLDALSSGDPVEARQQTETQYFQSWLERAVRAAHPQCFNAQGGNVQCPAS